MIMPPPEHTALRLTMPAIEEILRTSSRNRLAADIAHSDVHWRLWIARIVRPPSGLRIVAISGTSHTAIRLASEPRYPGEVSAPWWTRGDWLPCPSCGLSLLWCEAGFVPGFRICLAGHAVQISADGGLATRRPNKDRASARVMRDRLT